MVEVEAAAGAGRREAASLSPHAPRASDPCVRPTAEVHVGRAH
jgi:hypothetical protein